MVPERAIQVGRNQVPHIVRIEAVGGAAELNENEEQPAAVFACPPCPPVLADAGIEHNVGEDGDREEGSASWVAVEELVRQVECSVPKSDLPGGACESSPGGGASAPNVVAVVFVEDLCVNLWLVRNIHLASVRSCVAWRAR